MVVFGDPLTDPPPEEVALERAPLVRVIAQIRFSEVLAVATDEFVAPFQEAIRSKYPLLTHGKAQQTVFEPSGLISTRTEKVWRFANLENTWTISLSQTFLALETNSYTSRADFLACLREAVSALIEHIKPARVDRLGVRYIDRISGEAMDQIRSLIRHEICGIAGLPQFDQQQEFSITENKFDLPHATLVARWGQLAKNVGLDPLIIPALDSPNWILDLDMSTLDPTSVNVDVEAIVNRAKSFSERIYTFFRWVVTEDFLAFYGGEQK